MFRSRVARSLLAYRGSLQRNVEGVQLRSHVQTGRIVQSASTQEILNLNRRLFATETETKTEETLVEDDIMVNASLNKGLIELILPLPKRGNTKFSFHPSKSVGQAVEELHKEDPDVAEARLFTADGDGVGNGTLMAHVIKEPFQLLINDQVYPVAVPKQDEVEPTADELRMGLTDMFEFFRSQSEVAAEKKQLRHRLAALREELAPMVPKRQECVAKAIRSADRQSWFLLGVMGTQFGFLARLTWWDYSWDIIEPVTYFVTYGASLGFCAYYVLTRREYTFEALREKKETRAIHWHAKSVGLDVARYNEITQEIEIIKARLSEL